MSKNKDIEYLHMITGEPYKVCRTLMKNNHWDWVKAHYEYLTDFLLVVGKVEHHG